MTRRASASVATGTHIGPYEIVGWLGAGGMSDVYRARDPRLGREVAIKLIAETFATDADRVSRFEQEARASGQLNHPNILAVFDVGLHAGIPYIVSELLDGESLSRRLQGGPVPWRKALDYARQAAEGLAAAHDRGIVHRDVKPDNLFITHDGRVKILDFGIAKLTGSGDDGAPRMGATDTAVAPVVGTAGYMSPEQVRGESIDARSDIFSLGTVLYEMLSGRPPFTRATTAETMVAILKEDPPAPLVTNVPPALERIVARCLEKARETRFQSARDLAFGLECLSGTTDTAVATLGMRPRRWRTAAGLAVVVLSVVAAGAGWLARSAAPAPLENPLANAQFTRFTDWEGAEWRPEISPDGRFVAFLADRDGEVDLWLSQVGTGRFVNLTPGTPFPVSASNVLRNFGFSGDGAEIWLSGGQRRTLMPLTGGARQVFLGERSLAPSWSPDGTRIVYFNDTAGDPLFIADRTGENPRQILIHREDAEATLFKGGMHNHNPVWSPDGQWIYFVHGLGSGYSFEMDVWRVRPSGESPEQLTHQHTLINSMAPLDARTLLYIAPAEDRSGPWLWALDVATKATRRVSTGLDLYTSVAASRDGRRVAATVANPTAKLWRVPLPDRTTPTADDRGAEPYPMPTARALAPRFGGTALFYLSGHGMGDGLWRLQDGEALEIWKAADGVVSEPAAVSRDGRHVAVVLNQGGKRHLTIMLADGTDSRALASSIDTQGTADWSPDAAWIVTGGRDAQGSALFKIPVDGGMPVRLVSGQAINPVWSPNGNLIVYSGPNVSGLAPLLGVRPDGAPVELPQVTIRGGGHRFSPDGKGLVYCCLPSGSGRSGPLGGALEDFWLLDLATGTSRQLTRLNTKGADISRMAFDITPDGKNIVFDRSRENSDIVLIDLPK